MSWVCHVADGEAAAQRDRHQTAFLAKTGDKNWDCCATVSQNSEVVAQRKGSVSEGSQSSSLFLGTWKVPAAVCWRRLLCQQPSL